MAYRARSSQSYARDRRRGFNPPILPDVSEKMLREGERTIRSKADAFQAEIKNREDISDKMRENWQLERRSEAEAFNFEMDVAEAHRNAELQHYQTAIDDVKVRQAEWERKKETRDAIVEMIPQAIQAYGQFDQARGVAMEKEHHRILSTMQLTEKEKYHLAFVNKKSDDFEQLVIKVLNRERDNGRIGDREYSYLSNLSGRRSLVAQRWHIKNTAPAAIQKYLTSHDNTPVSMNDGTSMTLAGARLRGTPSDVEWILKHHQSNFISEKYGVESGDKKSHLLLNDTFTPAWNKLAETHKTISAANSRHRTYNESAAAATTGYANALTDENPGIAIAQEIQVQTGGDRKLYSVNKDILGGTAVQIMQFSKGAANGEVFNRLKDGTIKINGKDMPIPTFLGPEWWGEIENAYITRLTEQNKANEARVKAIQGGADNKLREMLASNGHLTNDQLMLFARNEYTENGVQTTEFFKNVQSLEKYTGDLIDSKLEGLYKYDEYGLNYLYLTSGQFPKWAIDKYEKHTYNGPNSVDKNYRDKGYQEIRNKVADHAKNLVQSDQLKQEVINISRKGVLRAKENFRLNIGNYATPTEAFDAAVKDEIDLILADKDIYSLAKDSNNKLKYAEGGFVHERTPINPNLRYAEYELEAREKGGDFLLDGKFHDDDIRALELVRIGKPMPGFISKLDMVYKDYSPSELANIILNRYGKKPIYTPGIGGLAALIPKEGGSKNLLTNKPSLSKTELCLNKFSKIGQTKPLILEACKRSKAVTKSENNGYDYYEVNGVQTELPENLTAEAYVNLGRDNPDDQAELGPYLFTFSDILNGINKGWILSNEILGEEQLDILQLESIYDRTSKLHVNGREIPGVGHSWLETNKAFKFDFGGNKNFDESKLVSFLGGR